MFISNDYLLLGIIIFLSNAFIILLIKNSKKKILSNFSDCEFSKVQSFHKKPALRIGGIFIFFFIIVSFLLFKNSELLRNIFYLVTPLFFFSLLEDLKIKIKPFTRLVLLFTIIFFFVKFFNLTIYSVQIISIDKFLNSYQFFSFIFATLCIVFLINGSNFIDGFNGLLGIHSLIIIFVLSVINYNYGNFELFFVCNLFLICLIIFLFLIFQIQEFF